MTLAHSLYHLTAPFAKPKVISMYCTLQIAADGESILGHPSQMAELALQIGEGNQQQGFQRLLQQFDPCSNRDKSMPVQQVCIAKLILCLCLLSCQLVGLLANMAEFCMQPRLHWPC